MVFINKEAQRSCVNPLDFLASLIRLPIKLVVLNIEERSDLLDKTFLEEGLYVPEQLQVESATRSIFDATKYYDQIAWFNNSRSVPNLSIKFSNAGNYNFHPVAMENRNLEKRTISYMMSDHYPLWAEFKMC